ncbi:MAG TPA: 2-amino-4-hydroxy-6-hydroxymethyldihydropteridine diphosphokinase [Vicinamibacterales bacterium]
MNGSLFQKVAIAIGSNLGGRERYLRDAVDALRGVVSHLRVSAFHETAPVGVGEQPKFLNGVVVGETALGPRALLTRLLEIEQQFGRERPHAGAPRTLDLDLILYGNAVIDEPGLSVPHPRFHERAFVLEPLAELAPDWRDPRSGLTVRQLLARLPDRRREHAVGAGRCPNCGAVLTTTYCPDCGQKQGPVNPSLHDLLHDTVHELLHVDGRIFRSVRLLLLRPGWLTREAFAGRRARYLTPMRLYLIFSVAYFAIAAVAPDAPGGIQVRATADESGDAGLQELGFASEAEMEAAVVQSLNVWIPRVMFILVPFFGALVMTANRASGQNYPQHFAFALHVHAAWFLAAAVVAAVSFFGSGVLAAGVQLLALAYGLAYLTLAWRTAYATTTASALWRAAWVTVVYLVAVSAAIFAIILPVIFSRR